LKLKTRALSLLILIAVACAAPAAGQDAAAWSRYTYPGEEFSVELPSMPFVHHTWRQVGDRPPEGAKTRVFGVFAGEVVYIIVAFDKPRSTEPDDRLAGYVWAGRGLTRKGDVRSGGAAGSEYDVGLYSLKGAARFFRTKGHAYLVEAFSDTDGQGEAIGRFLNSFALGAKPPGESITEGQAAAPLAPPQEAQTSGAVGDGPYKATEVERRSVIVYKPEPGFTEEARRESITGSVRLRAVLSSSGKVTSINVIKGLPLGLTEKAIEAARHILFFPASRDGRRVSQYVVLEYDFNSY
jgi:TonB family protein